MDNWGKVAQGIRYRFHCLAPNSKNGYLITATIVLFI